MDGKDLCLYEENKDKFGKPKNIVGFNAALREVEEEISRKVGANEQAGSLRALPCPLSHHCVYDIPNVYGLAVWSLQ